MTWIDDRLAEQKAVEERTMLVYNAAPQRHGELWNEIGRQIEEAKAKCSDFKGILRNEGGPQPEFIFPTKVPRGQTHSEPKKLTLTLTRDHLELKGGDVTFSFEVEGAAVALKHRDKTVTVAEAAMLILDPLLFPDLERIDPRSSKEIWKKLAG